MKKINNYQHILLIRTDRIGDVILTTPAISLLRNNYPEARISFLTREYTAPLLEHHLDLDHIVIYDPDDLHSGIRGITRLSRILRNEKVDLAILFHPIPSLATALFLSYIPHRIGTGYRWYSFLFNHRVYEHRKYGLRHELEYNLYLLHDFVKEIPSPGEIQFRFSVDDELKKLQDEAVTKLGVSGRYGVIHPGSGGSAPNLPPEMFTRIILYLLQNTDIRIILAGNREEKELLLNIEHQAGRDKIFISAGEWNLETYMAIISASEFFISNSTGPLHIARAYDIPLLAFYCPAIPCSPERWGPYHRSESVIEPDIEPCKTCNIDKCPHGNCLSHIRWETIEKKLGELLDQVNQ